MKQMVNIAFRYRYRGQNIKNRILKSSSCKQPYECKKERIHSCNLTFNETFSILFLNNLEFLNVFGITIM